MGGFMFDTYINEKISEKREYDIYLLLQYLYIYINTLIYFINNKNIRIKLNNLLKKYLEYTKKEYQLLKEIREKNFKFENDKDVIKLLDDLERLFELNYYKIENILAGYEDSFKYKNVLYSNFNDVDFNIKYLDDCFENIKGMEINENRKYRNKK